MTPQPPRQRIYLITPPVGDSETFARALAAALDAGDVAAVLLRLQDSDERTLVNRAKAIAAVVQPRDIALLLDGRPDIAIRAGCRRRASDRDRGAHRRARRAQARPHRRRGRPAQPS